MKITSTYFKAYYSHDIYKFAIPLLISLSVTLYAQGTGNTSKVEYGDAVYRYLEFPSWLNYNHAAIYSGMTQENSTQKVFEADGTALSDNTKEENFNDSFLAYYSTGKYYGAYTLNNKALSFSERKAIVLTAKLLTAADINWTYFSAIDWYGSSFDGSIGDMDNIRCDGVVEYSYEYNGQKVWWDTRYPNEWSIVNYCARHNDAPDLTKDPNQELSPWAQRGAPTGSTGPNFSGTNPNNTNLNSATSVNLPTYQITQTPGNNYVDITIKATDESGIHYIGYILPGEANWRYSSTQQQHPTSDNFSITLRITTGGYLYVFAMDNGGNYPEKGPGYLISIPNLTVTYPNGGESLTKGKDYNITWNSTNVTGTIQIDLYKGDTNVKQLAFSAPNIGSYPFNPPTNISDGTDYKIGISAFGGKVWGYSEKYFIITSQTQYSLTINSNNGAVTKSPDQSSYSSGTAIQLTATPNNGYTFSGWSGSGGSFSSTTSSTTTFTITGNANVTASFTVIPPTQYSLTVNATNGTVTKSPDQTSYSSGTAIQLTATPNNGYAFSGWSGSGGSFSSTTSSTTTFTITGNANVTASFTAILPTQYSLTVNATNGTVTKSPDQTSYSSGTAIQLTATPNNGYAFSGWSGSGGSFSSTTSSTTTFTITGNANVTASFTLIPPAQYSLTINANNGAVTKNPDQSSYSSGTAIQLTATPNNGYAFSGWSGSGGSFSSTTSNTTTFTITGNANVTANFTAIPPTQYSLTINANNGAVTKSPDQTSYSSGTAIQLTATPNNGYAFSGWSGSGGSFSSTTSSTTTFTITGNANVTASFTLIPPTQYSLTINTANGTVTRDPNQASYNSGTVIQLTAIADNGYKFIGWSGTGGTFSNTSSTPTNFTITDHANVTASFISSTSIPVITLSTTTLNFGDIISGQYSAPQSYTVSGKDLTGKLKIQATDGFEISLSGSSDYSKLIELFSASVNDNSIIIYVRFVPTMIGPITGNITHSSNGAEIKNISISGTGISGPKISLSKASLMDFGSLLLGTYSSPQTYEVSGYALTSDIIISSPSWFQISTNPSNGYVNSMNLPPTRGNVAATTIYVRYVPTIISMQTANIPHVSSGAESQYLYVLGTGSQNCIPVSIVTHPQNQTVESGKTVTFSLNVSGTGPFSYRWYKNDVHVFSEDNTTITTNSYITPPISNSNNNDFYYCRAFNCSNGNYAKSNNAYLTVLTDIESSVYEFPKTFKLYQNYPNPFNPTTNIKYEIVKDTQAKIVVCDLLGREIEVLVDVYLSRGIYEIQFDASNLSTGVYFYQLRTGTIMLTKKLIIMK